MTHLACSRCFRRCKGSSYCGLVGNGGDLYPWRAVYMSLIPVERVPLYHLCPGSTALRVVVPGAPVDCDKCWWGFLRDPSTLVLRELKLETIVSKARFGGADVVFFDGCEPLINDWVLEAIRRLRARASKWLLRLAAFWILQGIGC